MKPFPMITHFLLLLVGVVGIYYAYVQYLKTSQLLTHGTVTTATVMENMEEMDDESVMYRPKFQFMDQDHKPVQFNGTVSSSRPAWSVGEKTKVVYEPGRPDLVRIITYWSLHRMTILLAAFSCPFLVIGLGYFLFQLSLKDTIQ